MIERDSHAPPEVLQSRPGRATWSLVWPMALGIIAVVSFCLVLAFTGIGADAIDALVSRAGTGPVPE